MYGSTYGEAARCVSARNPFPKTPNRGNRTNGTHAVQAMGSASVNHQNAIRTATAAAYAGRSPKLSMRCSTDGTNAIAAAITRPATSGMGRTRDFERAASAMPPSP
jgi:hypothetical protein